MTCICDFCAGTNPRWAYPARDFDFMLAVLPDGKTSGSGSEGPWAACEECSKLIESDDYATLSERSFASQPHLAMDPNGGALRLMLEILHKNFRASRTGPREEIA